MGHALQRYVTSPVHDDIAGSPGLRWARSLAKAKRKIEA